jgi:V/A-type H+-transporting ATPase subunit F
MKFYVIGDKDTLLGFQLVGLEGEEVETAEEAREALNRAFQIEGLGIVIITERIASTIRSLVDQYVYTKTFPLIIEIPDRQGPVEGRKSIRELIRSAVGVHL